MFFSKIYWFPPVYWPKSAKNAEKTVKIAKKQQKYAYFCLFLAEKSRGT